MRVSESRKVLTLYRSRINWHELYSEDIEDPCKILEKYNKNKTKNIIEVIIKTTDLYV